MLIKSAVVHVENLSDKLDLNWIWMINWKNYVQKRVQIE